MTMKFSQLLLDWYARHARQMPWRDHPDPYCVWVSEIMLQQTRVETVIPYYQLWVGRFPTITALAEAPEQEVLRLWEGLGYYSRARNLHRAARIVLEKHGGRLPDQVEELIRLPGIGRYTAGAIASIAFGKDEAALDGNIRRVLSRVFDMSLPVQSKEGEARLWALARENLPRGKAGDYNQALMDLGAMVCLPRSPLCEQCPLREVCKAYQSGNQTERPVRMAKEPIPHYIVTAAVIWRDGQVLITQRPEKGLLGGLWEFPGGKLEQGENLSDALLREIHEELGVKIVVGASMGVYRHAYTHFRVTLHAFCCEMLAGELQCLGVSDFRWVQPGELGEFPMGKIDRLIAGRIVNSL